jgi:hypothetical protein
MKKLLLILSLFLCLNLSGQVKAINGLAIGSVKTVNELAVASVKTINGLSLNQVTPPPTTTNIFWDRHVGSSAYLNWVASPGATYYVISAWRDSDSYYYISNANIGNVTSVLVTGLSANSNPDFIGCIVLSCNSAGSNFLQGPWLILP